MKIGYIVQGTADEAFVEGLRRRWCRHATLETGRFRGAGGAALKRELKKTIRDLVEAKGCDVVVVLTDSDVNDWQDVVREEKATVPPEYSHCVALGVAKRNIECWLALDRGELAGELACRPEDLASDDPSDLIKSRLRIEERGEARDEAKERIASFVARVPMKGWINHTNKSFDAFYREVRNLSQQRRCHIPNEQD